MFWDYECGNCESTPCCCEISDHLVDADTEKLTNKRYTQIRNMKNIRAYYNGLKNKLEKLNLLEEWNIIKYSKKYIEDISDEIYYIELYLKEKEIN